MRADTKNTVNIEKLNNKQLEVEVKKVSDKIISYVDKTCDRANKLLKKYGLSCKMSIVIEKLTTPGDIV